MNQQSPSRTYRIWPRRADWLMQLVIQELASTIRASCAKLPALTISNESPAFGLDGNLIDKVRVGLIRGEKIQQASMIKANLAVSFNEAMLIVTAIEQAQHGS